MKEHVYRANTKHLYNVEQTSKLADVVQLVTNVLCLLGSTPYWYHTSGLHVHIMPCNVGFDAMLPQCSVRIPMLFQH